MTKRLTVESLDELEQFNFRVRKPVHAVVKLLAKMNGESMGELIDRLINEDALRQPEVILTTIDEDRKVLDAEEIGFLADLETLRPDEHARIMTARAADQWFER